jgi:tRNA(Ile)-lysidine synthase
MLLRPMLGERREALRALLREAGRDWIEDPGNAAFGRGRARRALTPLPEGEGLRLAEQSDAPAERVRGKDETGTHRNPSPFRARMTAIAAVRSSPLPLGEGFAIAREIGAAELAAVLVCVSGGKTPPRGGRLEALLGRLAREEDFTATLSGARVEANGDRVLVGREPGELRRRPPPDIYLAPGVAAVWDGRYELTTREPGWTVSAALGRLNALFKADRALVNTVPAWARGALPVLIRDGGDAPVLAWRHAEVRNLAPRRLSLAQSWPTGETTQESGLDGTIHGETPPADLF